MSLIQREIECEQIEIRLTTLSRELDEREAALRKQEEELAQKIVEVSECAKVSVYASDPSTYRRLRGCVEIDPTMLYHMKPWTRLETLERVVNNILHSIGEKLIDGFVKQAKDPVLDERVIAPRKVGYFKTFDRDELGDMLGSDLGWMDEKA